jgi:hypothetical protein
MTAGKYVIGRLKLQEQDIPANGRFEEDDGIFDYFGRTTGFFPRGDQVAYTPVNYNEKNRHRRSLF